MIASFARVLICSHLPTLPLLAVPTRCGLSVGPVSGSCPWVPAPRSLASCLSPPPAPRAPSSLLGLSVSCCHHSLA